jgi:hypothetical protein
MQFIKFEAGSREKETDGPHACCATNSSAVPLTDDACGDERHRQKAQENEPVWADGVLKTAVGSVYSVSHRLTWPDYYGEIKSRISGFRMKYSVLPGLYAMGTPNSDSDVLVTANYKLSFDKLRSQLKDQDLWILVLDTGSINVWCAAGKGTFGTAELIKRIRGSRLDAVVSHKRIILPQLSASGINAREVKRQTGFRVYFGPVHAKYVCKYLKAGYTATDEMRTIRFSILDRLILTPMELNPALRKFPLYALVICVIAGLSPSGILFRDAWTLGMPFLILGLIAIVSGAFVTPVLLPFIPFRSFAVKGFIMGMIAVVITVHLMAGSPHDHILMRLFTYLFFPLVSSYIALQFTGSTTFTGMSGVQKELKTAIPLYIAGTSLSFIFLLIFKISSWGVI